MKKFLFVFCLSLISGYGFADIASTKYVDEVVGALNIPAAVTEQTVSGWGFTKNAGTVTKVNDVAPVNGNVTLTIPTVTDTYSADSSDGMSGKAVASAISGKANTADLKTVATSGSYTDLSNKPTIPAAANNATLTIQRNGTTVDTWTSNASANKTINIPDSDTTYSAGTGISISGTTITNSAISQIRSGGSTSTTLANIWLE